MQSRLGLVGLFVGALLLAVALPAPAARARLVEDRSQNYTMDVPEGWVDLPYENQWKSLGIVYGAKRELKELDSGKKPDGQGGWLHLAITDAPEGKDIDAIAADKDVQAFLMGRFGDSWPEVEIIPSDYDEGLPVRVLEAKGTSRNLSGKMGRTRAMMILTVAKGKLFKVRMYAWTTEFDDEGMGFDLDVIEQNFDIIDKTQKKPEAEKPPPEVLQDPQQDKPVGDESEEKVFENRALGWKLVKPVGLVSKQWDTTDPAFEFVVAWFEDNRAVGSYQIILYVIRRGRVVNGQQLPDEDLKHWAFDSWWAQFTASHPDGEIATWKWPRRSRTFMVLPDYKDDEARKVLFADPDKRPIEVSGRDLIKDLEVAEKVKNERLGSEKTIEAYRANMEGVHPRAGRDRVVRYTWGTSRLTCMLVISLTRDAHVKWHDPINQLLASVEMTDN